MDVGEEQDPRGAAVQARYVHLAAHKVCVLVAAIQHGSGGTVHWQVSRTVSPRVGIFERISFTGVESHAETFNNQRQEKLQHGGTAAEEQRPLLWSATVLEADGQTWGALFVDILDGDLDCHIQIRWYRHSSHIQCRVIGLAAAKTNCNYGTEDRSSRYSSLMRPN